MFQDNTDGRLRSGDGYADHREVLEVHEPGVQTSTLKVGKIRKIPIHLRRKKSKIAAGSNGIQRLLKRLREDSQFLRSAVQYAFILLCIWVGIEFFLFVRWAQSGGVTAYQQRPPGAEGFLPISALMSLKYWIETGIINEIHPSGLFILIAIAAVGLFLKKAFCSWLCPIGTLSESLWMLGEKIIGRNIRIPKWIDLPLRSLKYLLLLFFGYSIWTMDIESLKAFIYSPYNKVADIKMYLFFAHISSFALWTILILVVLSVLVKNFWCRYLCPYGSLLGVLSLLSPVKITRNADSCIDCKLCTKACPAAIPIHHISRVTSDECSACYACVEACPVKDTLAMRAAKSGPAIPSWVFGVLVAGIFVAVTGCAVLAGQWQNRISKEEYLKRIQNIDSPLYQHSRGHVPAYTPHD